LLRRNISRLFINAWRDALSVLIQAILTVIVNLPYSMLILRLSDWENSKKRNPQTSGSRRTQVAALAADAHRSV
jgi:hypothetical protein